MSRLLYFCSMIKKECIRCGKSFWVHNYRKDNAKYCSRKCYRTSTYKSTYKNCLICGKKFEVSYSSLKRGIGKFCSEKCYGKWRSRYISEEEHPKWKGDKVGYSGIHTWIKKKLGQPAKCEHCGKIGEKKNGRWNIHWANKSGKYLRDKNDWIALCVSCHSKYDMNEEILEHLRKQASLQRKHSIQ